MLFQFLFIHLSLLTGFSQTSLYSLRLLKVVAFEPDFCCNELVVGVHVYFNLNRESRN